MFALRWLLAIVGGLLVYAALFLYEDEEGACRVYWTSYAYASTA